MHEPNDTITTADKRRGYPNLKYFILFIIIGMAVIPVLGKALNRQFDAPEKNARSTQVSDQKKSKAEKKLTYDPKKNLKAMIRDLDDLARLTGEKKIENLRDETQNLLDKEPLSSDSELDSGFYDSLSNEDLEYINDISEEYDSEN